MTIVRSLLETSLENLQNLYNNQLRDHLSKSTEQHQFQEIPLPAALIVAQQHDIHGYLQKMSQSGRPCLKITFHKLF